MTTAGKVWIGFGVALIVLICGGLLGYFNIQRIREAEKTVARSNELIARLEILLSTLKDAETGQRGYLLTGNEAYLEPYNAATESVRGELTSLVEMKSYDAAQAEGFLRLKNGVDTKLDELAATIDLNRSGRRDEALAIVRGDSGRRIMVDLRRDIDSIEQTERSLLETRARDSESRYVVSVASLIVTSLAGIGALGLVFFLSRRNARHARRAADVVSEQRERLRTTLASIGDAVISTDRDGRVTYMNGVAESLTGWKNHEAVGRPLTEIFRIVNETTRATVENPAERALREGVIVGLANHTVLIAKDGTEHPIDDSAAPIRCAKNEVVGCVLVFRDITERRWAERALRTAHDDLELRVAERTTELSDTNAFLNALLENLQEGIVACDANGVLTLFNQSTRDFHGLPEEKLPADQWAEHYDLLHADGVTKMSMEDVPLFRALRGEHVKDAEMVIAPKGGARRSLLASGRAITNDRGVLLGAVVSMHDVTRRRAAEESLRKLNEDLELRVEERTAMIKAITDTTSDLIFVKDRQIRLVFANPATLAAMGVTEKEAIGVDPEELFSDPAESEGIWAIDRRIMESGKAETVEETYTGPDGTRIYLSSKTPMRDKHGAVVGLIGVSRDITDMKRAEEGLRASEERFRFLDALNEATRSVSDPSAVMSASARLLGEHMAVTRCAYADVDPDNDRFTIRDDWRQPGVATTAGVYSLDLFGTRAAADLRQGSVLIIRDVDAELAPTDGADTFNAIGIKAVICCPLVKEGRLRAMMAVHNAMPRDWTADEVALIRETAERSWAHIERVRSVSALRDSEERYRTLFTSMDQGFVLLHMLDGPAGERNHDYRYLEANPAFERQLGLADPVGKTIRELVPNIEGHWMERFGRVADTGEPVRFVEHSAAIGRWYDVYAGRQGDPTDRRVAVLFTDITSRKRADEALRASEERMRLAVAAAKLGQWTLDLRSMEMTCSDGCKANYGRHSGDRFTYDDLWETVHPEDRERVLGQVRQAIDTRTDYDTEYRVIWPDGTDHWVLVRGRAEYALDNTPVTMTGVTLDITDRKRAEADMRASEERLRFIMDSMPQKIFTARPTGDVNYFNPQWMEYTGLTFEQIRDWGWNEFVHPEDLEENLRIWTESVETGEKFHFEHRFRQHDGVYRWHFSRAVALKDPDGKVLMWIGSSTDIDEQRRTANELRQLAASLSEADRRKNEFLAVLAHELRNPLAPIRNALQLMRMTGEQDKTLRSAAEMMERQVGQLVHLVDDLLDISRISRGKIELRREKVELASIVHHAVEAARPSCEAGGVELFVNLPREPIYLDADQTRLNQVIGNLLNNACKFTDRGGKIDLRVEQAEGQAVISVKDTGIGIEPEQIPYLFDMFVQADTSLERSAGGLGIGLTLVRSLVEMHGGTVEARSEGSGRGSEFIIRLPIMSEKPKSETQFEPAADGNAPVTQRRILVVDDNTDSAESLSLLLKINGHEVRTAHDGEAAVQAAGDFRPDVILLDIGLPKLNGYEAAKKIREQPWGKKMVLMALTGWGQEDDRQKSKEAGFDSHLVKPIDYFELERLLNEIS